MTPSPKEQLPVSALLAMTFAAFLALLSETLPAGMLAYISLDMQISEAFAGQFVTLYALGALVAAIPLVTATLHWQRRLLLLSALCALLVFNLLTALSSHYLLALGARFLAGMATGLIWGMLAGYARRLVVEPLKGKALAIVSLSVPLAFLFGLPLGTWLAGWLGWRTTLLLIVLLTLVAMVWVWRKVPDYPGQAPQNHLPLIQVLSLPGLRPVLTVLLLWVLAHSALYTYIVPLLVPAGLATQIDRVLLVFGLASVLGLGLTGWLISHHLRPMVLISLVLFASAVLILGLGGSQAWAVYLAIAVWGGSFGGASTLLQTATAQAAGENADMAQAMLTTVWNMAVAAGGLLGGILLETLGISLFPWVLLPLLALGLWVAQGANRHGFPTVKS